MSASGPTKFDPESVGDVIAGALAEIRRNAARVPGLEEKIAELGRQLETLNQQLNTLIQTIQSFGAQGR